MFEARVNQGTMWKKVIESVKELVTEANFDCTPTGISIQAMDTAHVALVNLLLRRDGFSVFNCERPAILGVNLGNLAKILKTTETNDMITLRRDDDSDVLSVIAEDTQGNKTSEFNMRLMEIEAEQMGIPEMDYHTSVSLPSAEFAKICRDMSIFGDTVTVSVARDGVKFSAGSEMGEGFAMLKAGPRHAAAASDNETATRRPKSEMKDEVKKERKAGVKAEPVSDDVPVETDAMVPPEKPSKAASSAAAAAAAGTDLGVVISLEEPVTLSFALRYFNTFAKGAALSDRVNLHLANDSPCMIEFKIEGLGYLRYYLAPKVDASE